MGDKLHLAINTDDRRKIRANHSSLHLLQSALREIIGDHVHQAGSFVCPDYGRFDFTHYEKVTNEQLKAIEAKVNEYICAGYPVVTEVMDIESAKKTGAMALFDEKYDDMVRVVTMGDASKEFCGGTHVANTAQIGVFKIISEESIGSGIRRITSKTSFAAYEEFEKQQQMLEEIARMLKVTSIGGVVNKVAQLAGENTELSRTIGQLKNQLTNAQSADMAKNAEKIGDLNVLITKADVETGELKGLAETLNSKLENGVVLVYGVSDGKVVFASACSKAAIAKGITASNIVKTAAQACGGNGGGRPDLASAGGKDASRIGEALRLVKELL